MATQKGKIAIIGSGLIGRSWAMLFASVGYQVTIYDIEQKQIENALADIDEQLKALEKEGLLRGKFNAAQQYAFIRSSTSLSETVADAVLIQECVPENLDLKKKVWKSVDDVAGPNSIYASSTSSFMPSSFSSELKSRQNFLIAHPVNPPYYVPLVELVPAPWTDPKIAKKTRDIMEEIGQTPVSLRTEIPAFALNRIQVAILNEVFNLVQDGIVDVKDVDKVISDGLGPMYAFAGPMETLHLNADGFQNGINQYGKLYAENKGKTYQPISPELKDEIADQLEKMVPLDQLQHRRNWRDMVLTKLSQLKKHM